MSKLKKDVKRHDFNISQKKLDDMYDDDTPINHLKWIGEDGEKTGVLVDNFLIQFKSVTKSLGQSESEILEFRIKKLEDQYSIVKEQWRRKMADYSEIVNVSESFVELKRVFDLLNEETLKCYINIRKIAKD
ncbi:hypothetical protein EFN12_03780 [Pediococcus pentosaceus]|uniref:hypothetical protein n=1 Tax=Pediococcus pentosaceus TaxID=1255 RepID=UPI0021A4ED05|nr:hypothetical protein [Pediococcus pentosaceus]MCT3023742.1 hypothetical protein [Pediococcus pentosaceus]